MIMKLFKMIAVMALMLVMTAQSAMALGKHTSLEDFGEDKLCEKLVSSQLKRQTAMVEVKKTERKEQREETGVVGTSI
jgi:hypothetical protein